MKKTYAVITGASSGIGAEFARQLAKEGYRLVLIARRRERLEALSDEIMDIYCVQGFPDSQKIKPVIITADLSETKECYRVMEELSELTIGVFINNAGFGDCGAFVETSASKDMAMIDVNIKALHMFTKLVIKKMQARGSGYLLNIASSAGLLPGGPYMATYYASKAYVTSLTRAVARELKESSSKVYIGALCPGPVNTEFNDVANVEFALPGISAEECVKEAIAGMKKRKTIIVPGERMKLAMTLSHLLPPSILVPITGHQQEKKLKK